MEAIATGAAANLSSEATKSIFQEIKRHMRYVIIFQKNVEKFEEKMKMLIAKRESVRQEVVAAGRNVEKIKPDVELWCERVDKTIDEEVKKVKDLEDKAKTKCFIGLCPNIKSRYQLSRKAEEDVVAVNELLQLGGFDRISYRDVPPQDASHNDFAAFDSRRQVFKDIMEALKDATTNMMGVYGMGGVGKTTLVDEVVRQVQEVKLFDSVIMVRVTQTPKIENIQDQIAELLGFNLQEKSIAVRARWLCERLKKEKKVLVVLDDIWAKLDLNEVGIPLGDQHKKCKILMTSRDQNVLLLFKEMEAHNTFALGVLQDDEAWDLFKKMAGDSVESPDLKPTTTKVTKKCGGLPIAISTVAMALRNKSLFEWKDALRQLQRPSSKNFTGISADIYSVIELSFNHLKSEELKQTFLLCSLLRHNALIQDLLKYAIGLGLIDGVNTVEEARDKLLTMVSNLKASCLLLGNNTSNCFDMHDLIRDVAISIASRGKHVFALKEEDVLKDWPDEETMKECNRISLQYPNISKLPPKLNCPQLDLFLLYSEDRSAELPYDFFKETLNLKVLDLTKMQFQPLPSSISLLTNLRTLCLDQCILGDISEVGALKSLEILSLLRSDIEMLPKEIGELVKLKLLDLSGCTRLKIIPPGLLSSLPILEELYMGDSFVRWEVERHPNQQSNASLAELKLLSHLTTLDIHIPDAKMMPADLFSEKLERYKIFIGKSWDWVGKSQHSRVLKLQLNTSIDQLDHGFKMFLKKTEDLYLDDMKGVKIALHELMDEEGFQRLKNLHIQNGLEIEYIISDNDAADKNEFLQLQSLTLQGLPQLISFCYESKMASTSTCHNGLPLFSEKTTFPCLENLRLSSINAERIWHNQLSNISEYYTQNLTSLIIEGCNNLKHLLSSSMARSLAHLKSFEIVECKCLREMIFTEDIEEENMAKISFPQLNSLKIKNLQNLIGFCSENYNMEFPSLKFLEIEECPQLQGFIYKSTMEYDQHVSPQALFDEKVAFLGLEKLSICGLRNMKMIWHNQLSVNSFCKLEKMAVERCNGLSTIFPFHMLGTFQQLQTLEVFNCGSVEHIFELQMLNMKGTHVVATQLRELYCVNLPKLKNVWNKDPQGILTFQNLSVVFVWNCWSLKNVFPASVARVLPQLKDLAIFSCAVEEIVSKGEGSETHVTFEFDQVSSLMLWNLPKLKCFYPGMHTTKWPMLKKLKAYHCNILKILDKECLNLPDKNEVEQLESPNQPSLFLVEKVIPKLEDVSLNSDDISMICDNKFSNGLFHRIKVLQMLCYHDMSAVFPITFLERFRNLEKLEVICCKFKHLFSDEGDVGKETKAGIILPIRSLSLNSLHHLKHIWMQESQLDHILPNLETLEVFHCGNMISLGLSLTPFQNLMTLDVWRCEAMINLATSLAVQSLLQLKILKIRNCVSMKEIVRNDGDVEAKYAIIFNRLKCLELRHLPSLKSFCSSNLTFGFPSLDQVTVSQCPELEIFCKGVLNAPVLQRVQAITGEEERGHWDGDLNSTVQQLHAKKVEYKEMEYLLLSEFSKSIEIWKQNLHESLDFKNLQCLEVCECDSLTYIFTASMALDLVQLQKLIVKNCSMMEQIIRNDTTQELTTNTIMFPSLLAISLVSCSDLKSFYLGDSTMEFPSLSEIMVEDCPMMFTFASAFIGEHDSETISYPPLFNDKVAFPNLRDLAIHGTGNWTKIWDDNLNVDSFQELNVIIVKNSGRVLNVFPFNMMERLGKLEELHILECESLEEIISLDHGLNSNESTNMFVFPKMRVLALHRLPRLKNFYSKLHTTDWPSLKELQVIGCDNMEILAREYPSFLETLGESQPTQQPLFWVGEVAFPKLETMKISHLRNMKMIWHNQLSANSFCKVENLAVEHCDELSTIFPFSMLRIFQQLQTLIVSYCVSLQDIFEVQSLNMEEMQVVAVQLRKLHVLNLPKLKHVWNKDTQGIVTCQNLSAVSVQNCWSLKSVFPAAVAKVLPQLQDLTVASCGVEEIVSKEEGWESTVIDFEFDQVSSLMLWNLPKLKCFYPGMYSTKWPMLKKLKTYHCNKVKILDIECPNFPDINEGDQFESPIQPPLFLVEKVASKLEEMSLTGNDIAMIRESKVFEGLFHEIKVLYLLCYHDESAFFPTSFLERFNNLEKLEVICCNFKDHLFSYEGGAGKEMNSQTLLQIRNLRLNSLHYLKQIWMQGSRLDHILPNLETLEVSSCVNLISLGLPSTSFQNLMTLDVWECEAMINLVTSLSVQSLVQLKILKIRNCFSMKEIVGNDQGDDAATYNIIFNRLKCLELRHLPSLKSFCSGNYTFGFPSLDQVIVRQCPELEIFCKGNLNAPILQRVQVIDNDEKGHWNGDLNSTIQQLYTKKVDYEGMECLMLSEFSQAIEIWKDNLQKSLDLKNLQFLEVYDCNSLTNIFTTSMALDLVQLKKMRVKNCPMMEQIIKNSGAEEGTTNTIMFPSLQSIALFSCSNLTSFYLGSNTLECPFLMELVVVDCPKMVGFASSSTRENIGIAPFFSDKVAFPNLRELGIFGSGYWTTIWDEKLTPGSFCELNLLAVGNCERLLNIFSFNMIERLDKLENLQILNCESLVEVIGPDQGLNSSESATIFIFPKIRFMSLHWLPKLKNFYSKLHTTNWPSLKQLQVTGCDNVKILAREYLNFSETFGESQLEVISSQQPLFWVCEDTFPNLECLHLEDNIIMKEIWHGQLRKQYFCKLTNLLLKKIPNGSVTILNSFIQSLPNLEVLHVREAPFNEIFECEELGVEEEQAGALARLSELTLSELPELTHLWKEEVPVGEVFSNLRILEVSKCDKLNNLVPSSVCFKNLTTLEVSKCQGLKNLVAVGTAKSLVLLRKMSIIDCQMIEEIIAPASGTEEKDGIVLSELKSLELSSLPSLSSFCVGNYSFEFPSLEEVIVRNCPMMKIFCQGELSAPNMQRVQFAEDKQRWDGNLNTTMEQIFIEMNVQNLVEEEGCLTKAQDG